MEHHCSRCGRRVCSSDEYVRGMGDERLCLDCVDRVRERFYEKYGVHISVADVFTFYIDIADVQRMVGDDAVS